MHSPPVQLASAHLTLPDAESAHSVPEHQMQDGRPFGRRTPVVESTGVDDR